MNIETFESQALETKAFNKAEKLSSLRGGFESSLKPENNAYATAPKGLEDNIANWLGIDNADSSFDLSSITAIYTETITTMYKGTTLSDGTVSLGLEEIHGRKIHPDYAYQNQRQQAGFAAEVISTAKDNVMAKMEGSSLTTYRADDLPDRFCRNDQYVDKVRINEDGVIVEKIQVKFVGSDAKSCLSKLESKDYDKFFELGRIDRMEVPKDYYPEIKKMIPDKIKNFEEQYEHVKAAGKTDVAENLEKKIARLQKIDEMLLESTVTTQEAMDAVVDPERYMARLCAEDKYAISHEEGMDRELDAKTTEFAVSSIDTSVKVISGEIAPQKAFGTIPEETTETVMQFTTEYISTAVSQMMSESSHELIQSLATAYVPNAMIQFGEQSFDSISDYATGVITGQQLAYELGLYSSELAGGVAGASVATAYMGPNAAAVGGMVGAALASEAYVSAVQFGSEYAEILAAKAQDMATQTVEIATQTVPDKVDNVINALNKYAAENHIPFKV